MHHPSRAVIGYGGSLCLAVAAMAQIDQQSDETRTPVNRAAHQAVFQSDRPETALWITESDRLTRVYGQAFSSGATAEESAETFRMQHARIFGVTPDELVPGSLTPDDRWEQPLMYDAATQSYKFTAFFYRQVLDGVPVYGGQLKLLVRNEPGFPLVLASADLREMGTLRAPAGLADGADFDRIGQTARAEFGPNAVEAGTRAVIFAGVDDEVVAPRAGYESTIAIGADEWLIITDPTTGEVFYSEHLICHVDIEGTVEGLATQGVGAEQCEPELAEPMPYLRVSAGLDSTFTDADGNFVIPHGGNSPITVSSTLDGQWFDVFDAFGNDATASDNVTPPGPASLLYNATNNDFDRASVNCYVYANDIRDFVLSYSPAYPTLATPNFTVNVNRTDGFCPGNAWYSPGEVSINFCQAGGSSPNTAWTSVIYHEYGHHLVNAAGSGQGQYGEGMGDVMSTIILDSPDLGLGFFGDCGTSLRNADNNHQYPCNGGSHDCGQLISGCVWDTRNALFVSDPLNYRNIISSLAVNSILMHTGSTITPQITIDFLTLDDDNANIFDGTPHYDEIDQGFSLHNMDAPELAIITFSFPGGLPDMVSPSGGDTVPVEVVGVAGSPESGTGVLHLDTGGGFVQIPMTETSPNVYDAEFPAIDCGTAFSYYFSAESTGGATATWPVDAPGSVLEAIAATGSVVAFVDDFESDLGWTTQDAAADGEWNRGIPVDCNRGDPPSDADGSGQCYLTDNSAANNCNSDVDDGTVTLISPPLDATVDNAFISYSRWYDNEFGDSPNTDTLQVDVSPDGFSWVPLETVGPAGPETGGGWFQREFRIDDFVPATATFRIRFIADDLGGTQSVVEAAVDGVQIKSITCDDDPEPCDGDTNDDGVVDVIDLVNIISAWDTADPAADLNDDGTVDVLDLVEVISAWGDCL